MTDDAKPKKRGRPKGKASKARPLPLNQAGDKALVAMAGHNRGLSQFLLAKEKEINRLEDQKKAIGKTINALYAECKQNGFPTQELKKVIKDRRLDKGERSHKEENIAIIKEALGEQLSLWDKDALGALAAEKEGAPDPAATAQARVAKAAAASAEAAVVEDAPLH